MNPAGSSRNKQLVTVLAVLLAIVIIVSATVVASKRKSDTAGTAATTAATSTQSTTSSTDASDGSTTTDGTYVDGTYSANATYQSPGGGERITVKLTVADGKVTASTVTTTPSQRESREYQEMFQSGYKSQVIGKAIDSISLNRVSGSSLTSEGFNSALDKIKQQAKA